MGMDLADFSKLLYRVNGVSGFDPYSVVTTLDDGSSYLQTYYRKLWFRLKYPNGLISTEIKALNPNSSSAIVEAKIFLDRADRESDRYAAIAHAQRREADGNPNFLEAAETAAVGRALSDLGFNIALVPPAESDADQIADAPIKSPEASESQKEKMNEQPVEKEKTSAQTKKRGQKKDSVTGMQQDKQPAMKEPSATEEQTVTEGKDGQFGYSELIQPEAGTPVELPETAKQEVEKRQEAVAIPGQMTTEDASRVTIPFGSNRGRSLGELVLSGERGIRDLEWIANSYNGPDETLRTAARLLIAAARS